jgi:trans-aconitate 3-methyltransferase
LATASMVTRWREANPDKVGTEDDCVTATSRALKKALGGKQSFVMGHGTVLLLFRKK